MLIPTALLASLTLTAPELTWHHGSLDSALAKARAHDRTAVVYFWRDGSEYCTAFFQETLADERVVDALHAEVLVSARHGTDDGNALFERYPVTSLPTLLFLRGDGTPDDIVAGYASADTLVAELERIQGGELTVTDLERRIAESEAGTEEHFEARFRLAVKRKDFGDRDGWLAGLRAIADEDRRGETLHGARAVFHLAEQEASAEADGDVEALDLRRLHGVARKLKHDEGRFEALDLLASLEVHRGELGDACRTWRKAASIVPEERAMGWCANVAYRILESEGERTSVEKRLALDLALRAAELAALEEPCGCDADCSCTPPEVVHAGYLAVLARVYAFNGESRMATATAERALTLDPSDALRERVSELL